MLQTKQNLTRNTLNFFLSVFTDEYYPSGYFPRTGTMGLCPRMNTIASRGQLKPIRIGENLEVNWYNSEYNPLLTEDRYKER